MGNKTGIEKLSQEFVRIERVAEDLEEKRKKVFAQVLELEDGGEVGGHKLTVVKKELAEILERQEIFKAKLAQLKEKIEAENLEILRDAKARAPENLKALDAERLEALDQAMELLARGTFLLQRFFKNAESPTAITFKKHTVIGTGGPADPVLARAKETYNRLLAHLPKDDPQAASYHDRRQEVLTLWRLPLHMLPNQVRGLTSRQIQAARRELG